MAKIISEIINDTKESYIGMELLDILTKGMYNNPLMIFREYIQNAVDSIDEAIEDGILKPGASRINIDIDGKIRQIKITDNGIGIPNNKVKKALLNIGFSEKQFLKRRGFRGIGRLGGLGYCNSLQFETKSSKDNKIAIIVWDLNKLNKLNDKRNKLTFDSIIKAITSLNYRDVTSQDFTHFFTVKLINVHAFHTDDLMNIKTLKNYLMQVAPVSYNSDTFSFALELNNYFKTIKGYNCYDIRLNGERLLKPYTDEIHINKKRKDRIKAITKFELHGKNGDIIGRGWYAITNYLGSYTQNNNIRGIRLRQGNIEVGGENILDIIYTEKRFSTWHIGEINLDLKLRLNARRDNFESSPDYEKILEQLYFTGRYLSNLCRNSSKNRAVQSLYINKIDKIENKLNYFTALDNKDFITKINEIKDDVSEIEKIKIFNNNINLQNKIKLIYDKIKDYEFKKPIIKDLLDLRKFRHLNSKELLFDIISIILKEHSNCLTQEELLYKIIEPYINKNKKKPFL